MKVLLLGEFSSLHKYLKEGLTKLGNDVDLVSNGDGWKQIGGVDICLPELKSSMIRDKMTYYREYESLLNNLGRYDVIQLINSAVLPPLLYGRMVRKLRNRCACLSLVAAGGDYPLYREYKRGVFEYYVYDHVPSSFDIRKFRGRILRKNYYYTEKCLDVVIPCLYEYSIAYKDNEKYKALIPFPINLDDIEYHENILSNGKVVFFHGLNRELAKGTVYIREALERLQQDFPNDVEVIIDGHMPFDRYVEVLNKANVVVDQCLSYGYGINACIAMAQGKVVVSGCRHETINAFGIDSTPMVLAKPDSGFLYEQFKSIVERKDEIKEWGRKSRTYVENLHDYRQVAQQYIDVWKSTGKV